MTCITTHLCLAVAVSARLSCCVYCHRPRHSFAIAAMKVFHKKPRILKTVRDCNDSFLRPKSRRLVVEYLLHAPASERGAIMSMLIVQRPKWHLIWPMFDLAKKQHLKQTQLQLKLGSQSRWFRGIAMVPRRSFIAIDSAGVVHDCNPEPVRQILMLKEMLERPAPGLLRAIMDIDGADIDESEIDSSSSRSSTTTASDDEAIDIDIDIVGEDIDKNALSAYIDCED
jgi:hypothetical protein